MVAYVNRNSRMDNGAGWEWFLEDMSGLSYAAAKTPLTRAG